MKIRLIVLTVGSLFLVYNECPVIQKEKQEQARKDQEQDVKNSNNEAEIKRLKKDKNLESKRNLSTAIKNILTGSTPEKAAKKVSIGSAAADAISSLFISCEGCSNPVSHPDEHWGTGGCAIGHKHWTCKESERTLHAGCYWVDEPETNPDKQYEGAKYSMTCTSCGNVRWTNELGTYMDWQNNQYCYTCQSMYGY